jgi:diguanylate cyclase (GGDEF)-like protein
MGEWPVLRAPRKLVAYTFAVDIAALIWCVTALRDGGWSAKWWTAVAILVGVALAFEEIARRAARLQLRLSSDMKRDMTSVWCIAGAVALPPAFAVILLAATLTYVWFRQQRPAGEDLHRKIFNAATAMIGCLGAGLVMRSVEAHWSHSPWTLSMSVVVVIVVHAAINRALVTVALVALDVRGRALLGTRDDNLVELATLCLGGLVAVAVTYQPWLSLLVLVPMVSLQRGALVRELEAAATTDSKTGLLNAVAWEHLAQREIARARRDGYAVAVLLIDIDRFKLVNDGYGHLIGDAVLRGVGRTLQAAVREYDTVGRFGGEEFVAVLPEAGDVQALVIAERLRARVNELRVSSVVDGVAPLDEDFLAVSIGVASTEADGEELSDLLRAADGALYRAKAGGRNRVVLADRGAGEYERVLTD